MVVVVVVVGSAEAAGPEVVVRHAVVVVASVVVVSRRLWQAESLRSLLFTEAQLARLAPRAENDRRLLPVTLAYPETLRARLAVERVRELARVHDDLEKLRVRIGQKVLG